MGYGLRFHLSTALAMMLAASGVVFLNTRPIWRVAEQGLLIAVGYGWPFQVYSTHSFSRALYEAEMSWWAVGCNAAVALLIVCYVGILCEWRRVPLALRRGWVWGSVIGWTAGGGWFGLVVLVAVMESPDLPTALGKSFMPWWQNWRGGLDVALVVGCYFGVNESLASYYWPEKLQKKYWWN